MKVALCAIAKNEDNYVDHWVKHYFDRGFDSITIYDNNDEKNLICKDSRVNIINAHRKIAYQKSAYYDFYTNNKDKFDWIAYFDLDEFIDCSNIKDVIEGLPKGADQLQIKLMNMSDSDYLHADYSVSPFERFKEPTIGFNFNIVKTIVKTTFDAEKYFSDINRFFSAHYVNPDFSNTYFSDGTRSNPELLNIFKKHGNLDLNDFNKNEIIMHHCDTKSIEEYLLYKFGRTDAIYDLSKVGNMHKTPKPIPDRAFFSMNRKTREKLEMLSQAPYNNIMDLILDTTNQFDKKLLDTYRKIYIKENKLPVIDDFIKLRVKLLNGKDPLDEPDIAEFYIEDNIKKRKSIGQIKKYF